MQTCRHCGRTIELLPSGDWIDPEATGDDEVWRFTCDSHETFIAEHEPSDVLPMPYTEDDWREVRGGMRLAALVVLLAAAVFIGTVAFLIFHLTRG